MPLGDIVTKDDAWAFLNSVTIFLVFFPLPENITRSSFFLLVTIGIFILVHKLSEIEGVHKRIFFIQLIDAEIQKRRATSDPDYDHLPAKGRDEVDKIDEYFHSHAKTFTALLILTLAHLFLILLQVLNVIDGRFVNLQTYHLNVIHLVSLILAINVILMYSTYQEIRKYLFVDLKEVYEYYDRSDGERDDVSN